MAKKTITCLNCGRTIEGVKAAQNDGWLLYENDGDTFCCCVCRAEYYKKAKTKKTSTRKK